IASGVAGQAHAQGRRFVERHGAAVEGRPQRGERVGVGALDDEQRIEIRLGGDLPEESLLPESRWPLTGANERVPCERRPERGPQPRLVERAGHTHLDLYAPRVRRGGQVVDEVIEDVERDARWRASRVFATHRRLVPAPPLGAPRSAPGGAINPPGGRARPWANCGESAPRGATMLTSAGNARYMDPAFL